MCLIFDMRNVKLPSGKIVNIYKLVDITYGLYFNLNNIHTLLPVNSCYTDELLYIVSEKNKTRLGDIFNREGFYAGSLDQDYIEELLRTYDNDIEDVKNILYKQWGEKYYFLEKGTTFTSIRKDENIKLVEDAFLNNVKVDNIGSKNKSSNNKILSKYGTFLTDKDYLFNPAIGRDNEIERLERVLLSFDKSGMLVGESGVGKTAIVEGLAYKIREGIVHEKLKGYNIISIDTASMIAGCRYVGDSEKRMKEIIGELEKHKNIIMFVDEIHTLIGAGRGDKSNLDVANILKPYLDRGEIKIIGSTTFEEYDNMMVDTAFKRRFNMIKVLELEEQDLYNILDGVIEGLEKYYNVKFIFNNEVKNKIYKILYNLTNNKNVDYKEKCSNPDLILSIIKEAFNIASFRYHNELELEDIINAIMESDRIYESVRKKYVLELRNMNLENVCNNDKDVKVLKFTLRDNDKNSLT